MRRLDPPVLKEAGAMLQMVSWGRKYAPGAKRTVTRAGIVRSDNGAFSEWWRVLR